MIERGLAFVACVLGPEYPLVGGPGSGWRCEVSFPTYDFREAGGVPVCLLVKRDPGGCGVVSVKSAKIKKVELSPGHCHFIASAFRESGGLFLVFFSRS